MNGNTRELNRRDFLKITAVAGLSLGLGAVFGRRWLESHSFRTVSETHYLMGTIVNFSILTDDEIFGRAAIQSTIAEMKRLISIFDHRSPDNQLARLNKSGYIQQPDPELKDILLKANALSDLTKGAFDITVKSVTDLLMNNQKYHPDVLGLINYRNINISDTMIEFTQPGMAITLDGIAKGCIVDGGLDILRNLGFGNILVEAGGDLMTSNNPVKGHPWKIGIKNPRSTNPQDYIAKFEITNKAVATSGDYENHFSIDYAQNHIIDPRTGHSPTELASVTIIANTATEADALSTATMVLGTHKGFTLIESLPDTEAFLVTKQLSTHKTSGFPI